MASLQSGLPANGPETWPPAILNFAIGELRREFPAIPSERIVRIVDMTARTVSPATGRVVLLQRARERLRTDPTPV